MLESICDTLKICYFCALILACIAAVILGLTGLSATVWRAMSGNTTQAQSLHRYPPIIVNVTTPDGQTFEATAEFEDEAEQQQ